MVARLIPVAVFDLVVFGGSGDLAKRKIMPSLYLRYLAGQMPKDSRIIASARSDFTKESYCSLIRDCITRYVPANKIQNAVLNDFLHCLDYVRLDSQNQNNTKEWNALKALLRNNVVRTFYFSVAPNLFSKIAQGLKHYHLFDKGTRIIVEKPFGKDRHSAERLNADLTACFQEQQIYRIDHYLGKETVQNVMALRFANALFEPVWNSHYIDHVQITVSETMGIAGRGAYYNAAGAMRDMVQNHLLQLLCLIAMETPSKFTPNAVRDEKIKVIRALDPVPPKDIVRGQYTASATENSYCQDANAPNSTTESYVALLVHIANWRWNGTDFYLRTGKRMGKRLSEINVVFKNVPHSIFAMSDLSTNTNQSKHNNILSIRLQPNEGITLSLKIKDPGPGGMRFRDASLDMTFAEQGNNVDIPDAYERLIMDVIRGNQTLFMRGDEVSAAWDWIDPIIAHWEAPMQSTPVSVPFAYAQGSAGPEQANALLHRHGRHWIADLNNRQ